jgi:hypothetical protein
MSADNAIWLRDFGIPNIYAMNGVKVGEDYIEYKAMTFLCDQVLLSQCQCNVKLTRAHLRTMFNELGVTRRYIARMLDEPESAVDSWFRDCEIPAFAQNYLKFEVNKKINPDLDMNEHLDLLEVEAPARFEFTYDAKSKSWAWSNRPTK